jgi:hypothetical protein
MGTARAVGSVPMHARKTPPAEVVAAAAARHVVASAVFQDAEAASRTVLCAHLLDPVHGLVVFLLRGFVAGSFGVPRAVTGQTVFVLAVRTSDFLWCVFRSFAAAIFYGEVFAALGGETGNVCGV